MAPKKAVACLGSVQPIADCWRAEVSEVGKGPSRLTKAHAEQDLEVARGAESRTDMGARLRQLVESDGCVVVVSSADDRREDLPCANGVSPPCLAGASERKSKYPRVDAPRLFEVEDWRKAREELFWRHVAKHDSWKDKSNEEEDDGLPDSEEDDGPMPEDK